MTRSLGPVLPDRLLTRLMAPADAGAARPRDRARDHRSLRLGAPRPPVLRGGPRARRRAASRRLHAGSRSSRHLRESGRATLVFADAELCLYVKVEAPALPGTPRRAGLARFELVVRDVLEDRAEGEEAGARLSSGLDHRLAGRPAGGRRALRADPCGAPGVGSAQALVFKPTTLNVGTGRRSPFSVRTPTSSRFDHVLDGAGDTRRHEDLAALGLAAQARREVRDRADGAVVPAPLEPDGADRGVTLGDADAEPEVVTALAPGGARGPRPARASPRPSGGPAPRASAPAPGR